MQLVFIILSNASSPGVAFGDSLEHLANESANSDNELFQPKTSTPRRRSDTINLELPRKGLFSQTADLSGPLHKSTAKCYNHCKFDLVGRRRAW